MIIKLFVSPAAESIVPVVALKSTVPPPVVKVMSPVANSVASLISIFPAFVVIFPFRVIPPEPSMVTLPMPGVPAPIAAILTVPEPASRVTVVV